MVQLSKTRLFQEAHFYFKKPDLISGIMIHDVTSSQKSIVAAKAPYCKLSAECSFDQQNAISIAGTHKHFYFTKQLTVASICKSF